MSCHELVLNILQSSEEDTVVESTISSPIISRAPSENRVTYYKEAVKELVQTEQDFVNDMLLVEEVSHIVREMFTYIAVLYSFE